MSFIKKITMTAFALSFTMCLVPQANAAIITPIITPGTFIGGNGNAGESLASTRYRAFFTSAAQQENFLGIPSLGTAANRVGQDINWGNLTTETFFDFSFQYDKTNDMLISILGNNVLQYTDWSTKLAANTNKTKTASDLNAFQISIGDRSTTSSVRLKSLVLDGISLGDFTGSDTYLDWLVTGPDLNLTDGFILSGQLGLQGTTWPTNPETSVVNLTAGWDARGFSPAQVPAPGAFGLFALGLFGLFATRRFKS
ncbi:hypothetical protein GCM10008111_02100 [Alishewanella tabrizica]|uniref:Ice-binding protein C-terminal domain-containing protein n=2 Tax=Alishewanella tabrizica TaxID=671278 RepID=A0ABQ2WEL7_9ALTE|nr:hypothetical protein GCM10008111_02100 [Alishewanella tabrizica]